MFMGAIFNRACRHRYVVLTVVAVVMWIDAISVGGAQGQDWHYFLSGAGALTGTTGLHVYAQMPDLQFGPLALVAAVPLRYLGPLHGWYVVSAAGMALGVVAIRVAESTAAELLGNDDDPALARAVLVGGAFVLAAWTSGAVTKGHPDDVLAMLGIAFAARAASQKRWLLTSLLVGLAAAAKPWAMFALPLAAAVPRARWRGPAVALVVAIVPWLPFLVADPKTLRVGSVHLPVNGLSTLHALGLAVGSTPAWPREAQLVVAVALGFLAVRRGTWWLVPIIAAAVRVNLDPAAVDTYGMGVIYGALLWDLISPLRVPAQRTIAAWFAVFYVLNDLSSLGPPTSLYRWTVVLARLLVLVAPVWATLAAERPRTIVGNSL